MSASHGPIRVGVLGAAGKMGVAICQAVDASDDFELVAAVDPFAAGRPLSEVTGISSEVVIAAALDALVTAQVEVAVDFTSADSAVINLGFCAANGINVVCGTTGIAPAVLTELSEKFTGPPQPNCVVAPNFAISAALLMRFCELASPYFSGVEVIELHHDQKRDAPSGTALETARRIAGARKDSNAGSFAPDPTRDVVLPGARGGDLDGVHVHSVRLAGLVAHEEVIFGTTGQSLTIRQDSYDRSSFLPGVLLACRRVLEMPGFTFGLDRLITL